MQEVENCQVKVPSVLWFVPPAKSEEVIFRAKKQNHDVVASAQWKK
jgi:hypothetical protein